MMRKHGPGELEDPQRLRCIDGTERDGLRDCDVTEQ